MLTWCPPVVLSLNSNKFLHIAPLRLQYIICSHNYHSESHTVFCCKIENVIRRGCQIIVHRNNIDIQIFTACCNLKLLLNTLGTPLRPSSSLPDSFSCSRAANFLLLHPFRLVPRALTAFILTNEPGAER